MPKFNPEIQITPTYSPLGFQYGKDCFGPDVENRTLDSIRKSLKNPNCKGPETVYSIAMDVGKSAHKNILEEKMLLFGVVTFAAGKLGDEPVRSQGHIHKRSSHSGWSPPEVYEVWSGKAIIYMQEKAEENPGRCFAVYAEPGDVVIVPPNWAHATISADPLSPLTFGAWCDREYGFEYDKVRERNGLAWYPVLKSDHSIDWVRNPSYQSTNIIVKRAGDYSFLGIRKNVPIYKQFEMDLDLFQFVSKPYLQKDNWLSFTP
jgi:glucose-6-phosphate isomerase, archaeal